MRRTLVAILAALVLFAGCTKQAEYGPKGQKEPQRYEKREFQRLSLGTGVYTIKDTITGDEWLIFASGETSVLLRHTTP